MSTETRLSVVQMCEVAGFSRAGFYRFQDPQKPAPRDMKLREDMQKIAVEWPCYGSRRMARELRDRGWDINRKRVQRLMREDNLLCVAKRKFVVTTDSGHEGKVYPNLAGSMLLTDVDQLWIADITYIRLEEEFVYLAVILDAYSMAFRRRTGEFLDANGSAHGAGGAEGAAGVGTSFGPWGAVCQRRLHGAVGGERHRGKYESQRKPLGQRGL